MRSNWYDISPASERVERGVNQISQAGRAHVRPASSGLRGKLKQIRFSRPPCNREGGHTMQKPLLSIGMIFRNEIRCIERCMESLRPLREAINCELVMADTGSNDGSQEVAERYADILFDFPWIDDFAAARNAVMDRCSGEWFMFIDADEWLDGDISQLLRFLRGKQAANYAVVFIRNYKTASLEKGGIYADFYGCRIMRMSTGNRFRGAIHEHWDFNEGTFVLDKTLLHHDGYINDPVLSAQKRERNMGLMRREMEKHPKDIVLLMQTAEASSGGDEAEHLYYIRKSVQAIKDKWAEWEKFGAAILRRAVQSASGYDMPELGEWIEMAETLFPDSFFTRIDIAYVALGHNWNKGNYDACVRYGESYLKAVHDYETLKQRPFDIAISSLSMFSEHWKQGAKIFLAMAYLETERIEQCTVLLDELDGRKFDKKQAGDSVRCLLQLHTRCDEEMGLLIKRFWEQISEPVPSKELAQERRSEFLRVGSIVFSSQYRANEAEKEGFRRHAYTLFLPLEGECELGNATAVLECSDPGTLAEKLGRWDSSIPAFVLAHALENGMVFPIPGHPLKIEEMDTYATRLADLPDMWDIILRLACKSKFVRPPQELCWDRAVVIAAVRRFDWDNSECGMLLARRFAEVEREFVALCYSPETLTEENIFLLPPMHRFGWYCAQAFEAMDKGDLVGYTKYLRLGLENCPEMKHMVNFLMKEGKRRSMISEAAPELIALAEQVRTILAAYDPDDPAVAALKESHAYKQVSWLIEEPTTSSGGLVQ